MDLKHTKKAIISKYILDICGTRWDLKKIKKLDQVEAFRYRKPKAVKRQPEKNQTSKKIVGCAHASGAG